MAEERTDEIDEDELWRKKKQTTATKMVVLMYHLLF
jgi:hypothetical protein